MWGKNSIIIRLMNETDVTWIIIDKWYEIIINVV